MARKCQNATCGQFHSITSSAVASSKGGTLTPTASAVLRLITRSNLSGRCIGQAGDLTRAQPGFDGQQDEDPVPVGIPG
jgi:hypothetical protein